MTSNGGNTTRFVDARGLRVEPISTAGVDWWYGFDERGHYTGVSSEYDELLLLRMRGVTTISRMIAYEVA